MHGGQSGKLIRFKDRLYQYQPIALIIRQVLTQLLPKRADCFFFRRRRTKQLPLAKKENVLGDVVKRTWAHSFALRSSGFPSRFFSFVDLWLSLLVQHDTDKGFFYNISFPEDRCEVMTTGENEVATCDDLTQILRHKLVFKTHGLVTRYRSATSLNLPIWRRL